MVWAEDKIIKPDEKANNQKSFCGGFFLFTFSVLLIGCSGFLVAQTWVGYNRYQNYTFFYDHDVNLYGALPTVCDVVLAIVFVNTVVGFLSIFLTRITLLLVNGFISCATFFILIAVLCLALTMDSDAFLASLNIPVHAIKEPEIKTEVNFIQNTVGCCGSNDYRDYLTVEFPANMSHTIVWRPDESTGNLVPITLPATCCVNPEELFCVEMWSLGCKAALVEMIERNFNTIVIVGGCAMGLSLLTIIFAVYAYRGLLKDKNEEQPHKQISIVLVSKTNLEEEQGNHDKRHHLDS